MGPFGSSIKVSTFVSDGIPVISGQHLRGSRLQDIDYKFVTEAHADQLAKANVQRGDVILTHAGNIGQVAYIPNSSQFPRYVISQRQFYIRCDPSKLMPEFLVYYFESHEGRHRLLANANQTGVPSLSQPVTYIRKVEIPLPPVKEQRAIAGVLGALDDKIESNSRIVRTAREFIDVLFRAAFSNGEINVQVSSLAEVIDCLHTKKPDQALEGKQLLQLSNISDDGFLILGNHYPISLDDYNKWTANIEANEGDLILTNVGRVGALARVPKGVKAALGRNMTAIRARKPSDALFIFAALNNAEVRSGMKSLIDVGTIMDALNVHAIRRILLPDSTALQRDRFATDISDLVDRAEVAVKESGGLKVLRDVLLPELLTGQLRVKDAESMMGNV
jgi:restriction endonuclease S subunit